jgi:hypothetical protein
MQDDRLLKLAITHHPVGNRSRGRLKKKWKKTVLGRELRNTGLICLVNNSSKEEEEGTTFIRLE